MLPNSRRAARSVLVRAAVAGSVVLLAGCSGDSNDSTPTQVTQPATSTTTRPEDGSLVVGAVLPTVGPASDIGVSMTDALQLGVEQINDAGGVNGRPLRLVLREEGDNTATAGQAVQNLLQLGADAIIGPTSSPNLLATLGSAVEAGVLTCGPTASALALDAFPDNGLLFRTVPSDSLQAQAMARVVESSGASSAVVVYLDDAYGRPFAQAVRTAISRNGTTVTDFVGFTAGEASISDTVSAVVKARPEVVVVVADAITGPTVINAIDAASSSRITYVVNDATRRPDASARPYKSQLAHRVIGVSPLAYAPATAFLELLRTVDPDATGLFAHNAYDCLNIIALAATAAGSSQPAAIAAQIAGVTANGTRCSTFADCVAALDSGRNINYDGPGGVLAINSGGEMTSAVFERFTFDDNGRDIADGFVRVGDG